MTTILHDPLSTASRDFLASLGLMIPEGDDVTVTIGTDTVRIVSDHATAVALCPAFPGYPVALIGDGETRRMLAFPASWGEVTTWAVGATSSILADAVAESCARIDAYAESLCNQVITPGSAQMARYQRKETQARAYLGAMEAGTLPEDADALAQAYPAVVGEVSITAETPEAVARVIVAMANAWWAYGDAVEAARLAGKRAVEAAGTPAAVAAAEAAIVWPAVPG